MEKICIPRKTSLVQRAKKEELRVHPIEESDRGRDKGRGIWIRQMGREEKRKGNKTDGKKKENWKMKKTDGERKVKWSWIRQKGRKNSGRGIRQRGGRKRSRRGIRQTGSKRTEEESDIGGEKEMEEKLGRSRYRKNRRWIWEIGRKNSRRSIEQKGRKRRGGGIRQTGREKNAEEKGK
jgi:hypothetical protein